MNPLLIYLLSLLASAYCCIAVLKKSESFLGFVFKFLLNQLIFIMILAISYPLFFSLEWEDGLQAFKAPMLVFSGLGICFIFIRKG